MTLAYILFFTFIGSVASLIGGVVLLFKESFAIRISHFLAAFAAGTLLGAAFFDLLPEAAEMSSEADIFLWCLLGILFFFIVERLVHWFHHHHIDHGDEDIEPTVGLIMIGDSIHNFIDGVVIAGTFMVSIPLGIVTTFAVAAHEIPQEIGDFGIMLHKGVSGKNALLFNALSSLTAFAGALLTFFIGPTIEEFLPYLLALTAGFFIYIAASDLIPQIHEKNQKNLAIIETLLLLLGVVVIKVFVIVFGV